MLFRETGKSEGRSLIFKENMDAYIHKFTQFLNDVLRVSGVLGSSTFKDKWDVPSPDGKSQFSEEITEKVTVDASKYN